MHRLQHNISLADYLSWKTGGMASQFFQPENRQALVEFLPQLPPEEKLLWLGLGSNLLVRDGGFAGTVIFTQKGLRDMAVMPEHLQLRAEAGVACPRLARFAAKHNLVGGEWFAGIPGTLGGALAMNAGAFGGETWEHVVSVETIDRQGRIRVRFPRDFAIAYRQVMSKAEEWFIAATLQFKLGDQQASLSSIKELLKMRARTQPTGVPTCGSVFRNPPNDYAARLIESCGLKGFGNERVHVSKKHANFIVNLGGASAYDIETLINEVATIVDAKMGVRLEREVKVVGNAA